ncbi:hypothetical protein Hanom_Chr14g01295561 [Helianthus anomalus]
MLDPLAGESSSVEAPISAGLSLTIGPEIVSTGFVNTLIMCSSGYKYLQPLWLFMSNIG